MKKLLLNISLMIILATVLAGCGGSNDSGGASVTINTNGSNLLVSTSLGIIEDTTIHDIPFGTSRDEFITALEMEEGTATEIYQKDSLSVAQNIKDEYLLVLTHESFDAETYTLYLSKDPSQVVSFTDYDTTFTDDYITNSDPDNPNITITEGFSEGSSALDFSYDVSTVDYVVIPDNDDLDLRDQGTVEVVIKANSFPSGAGIVSKGESSDYSDEAYGLQLYYPKKLMFFIYDDEGSWIDVNGSYELSVDTWYHVIGTWDESTMYLYVNGVLEDTRPNTTGGVRSTDGGLTIGSQLTELFSGTNGNWGWDGIIERVIVLKRVLTQEEVTERYNSLNLP